MKVFWSPEAREDIRQIYSYYAERNPVVAEKIIEAIISAAMLLEEYPHLGREADSGKLRLWQVPRHPYLLPYRVSDNKMEISAVFDERQKRPDEWA